MSTDPLALDYLSQQAGYADPFTYGDPNLPVEAPSISDPGIIQALKGTADLISLVGGLIQTVIGDVSAEVSQLESTHPLSLLTSILQHLQKAPSFLAHMANPTWNTLTELTLGNLYKTYLEVGLGLTPDKFDTQGKAGVLTVDHMLGFAYLAQLVGAAIDAAGEGILANRWAKAISKALMDIPEEMGLSWAMGMQIDKAFEAAVGRSVEENINRQKRPNAPEWPIIRTMLRQHVIKEDALVERLQSAGFTDDWINRIKTLADAVLPVGDLQNGYLHELLTKDDVLKGLSALGFNEKDQQTLATLYIDKAETEASRTYVSTARQLFRNFLITQDAYTQILQQMNYPSLQIADDVAAITLEHQVGRINNSTSTIKAQYQHKQISADIAKRELLQVGLAPEYATELIQTWDLPPLTHTHGMSASRILSYLISGILDPQEALDRLTATGLNPTDAAFEVAHPTARPGVKVRPLTPNLVTTAYVDGIIDDAQLEQLFVKANVDPTYIPQYIAIAKYRKGNNKHVSNNTTPLTVGELLDAFQYGIMDAQTVELDLQLRGYSPADAQTLLEVKNKGRPLVQPPPVFTSLSDAIAYLIQNGYQVEPPPDPMLVAAEGMVLAAGYSILPPAGKNPFVPPPL